MGVNRYATSTSGLKWAMLSVHVILNMRAGACELGDGASISRRSLCFSQYAVALVAACQCHASYDDKERRTQSLIILNSKSNICAQAGGCGSAVRACHGILARLAVSKVPAFLASFIWVRRNQ